MTATDATSGTGLWLHHEVVAPHAGDPYAHGWVAAFPRDASPWCARFGPVPAEPVGDVWFDAGDVARMSSTGASGRVGDITWQLAWTADAPPLWTFPRWAWRREVLPAAQMLPVPSADIHGHVAGSPFEGRGGVAHIYGHGNAQRWVWLHADLGNNDVLEIVAATARRRALRKLPPLPLVQLRVGGRDWPRDPLAAAPLLRAHVGRTQFRVGGIVGTRRISVRVELPPDRCLALGYVDPDGATATCTNTESADASVRLDRLTTRGWRTDRSWSVSGSAHAEIGTRP